MKNFDIEKIPRMNLCALPTPIQHLKRLSSNLKSVEIYIKRDDLTGIAFGGNKNRKLEFLLSDAIKKNCDIIITEGAITSNHCLQTAACAAKIGLDCELVLSDSHIGNRISGNLLLDTILDVKIHRVSNSSERKSKMKERAEILTKEGRRPYIIPTGGSNAIGSFGYINCFKEIALQSKELGLTFDYFVIATGSAGTQAGCLAGKKIYYPNINVIGINVGDNSKEIIDATKHILSDFERENHCSLSVKEEEIIVFDDYFGEGYGIPYQELIDTLKLVAKYEGIFLDPVYNGKAMVGLLDLIKKKYIKVDSKVLFLHSGGGPAIFSYENYFLK
ncbi:MAG: D-cysteine desulfhydrase family protein [Candidatus Thorarchaeota archaeon]